MSSEHPVLFCLSGTLKGATVTPRDNPIVIGSATDCSVRFPPSSQRPVLERHAEIEVRDGQWILRSLTDEPVILNERPVQEAELQQNDLVRLGENGPVLRFRISRSRRPTKTFQQVVADATSYASENSQRGTRAARMTSFARQLVKDAVANGTRRLRVALVIMGVAVIALAVVLVSLVMESQDTKREFENRADRTAKANKRLLALLEEGRAEHAGLEKRLDEEIRRQLKGLVEKDLENDRVLKDLATRADRMSERMTAAEDLAGIAKRIHKDFHAGVCFIYIGVAFYSEDKKEFVRYVLDPATGEPDRTALDPFQFGGNGPKRMEWVSGSGFVVDKKGHVVSNRHVIDPWYEDDRFGEPFLGGGMRAVREVFIACFPGREEPISLIRVGAHASGDIAVAKLEKMDEAIPVLPLAEPQASIAAGTDVYLLGYPEGLRGIIHKLPSDKAKAVFNRSKDGRADLVTNLAKMKGIDPVFTMGGLSNIGDAHLVYDAVTYSGGSGGPLFNDSGVVIGVNTAISRNFTGANYGTRIRFVHELLKSGDLDEEVVALPELSKSDLPAAKK
ncbi:MAG: trypsin-like peptidase domain-containing protein [Planctomycetes bacterium]|nr:trypsin-like peptidase domain-containing protein [Planctomycetota bacterium]